MIRVIGQIEISVSDDLRRSSIGAFQRNLAWSYQMHRKYRLLLSKLVPKAIPLKLSFHLELLVEDTSLCLRRYRSDLRIDLLLASFPKNDNIHGLLHSYCGLPYIQIDGNLLLVLVRSHFVLYT